MAFHSNLLLSGFSPQSLFAAGEQGVWYDPSDLSSMWQDVQGTTAVTGVEQAVGLILDKREGRGLGAELVTNNTFATDTDWTKGTGWSIGSGVATKTAGTASVLSQAESFTAGHTYRLVYTITRSAGSITPQFTGGSTVAGTARSAAGTYVEILTAVSGNTTLEFSADASFAGTVDNVYLKRVSGNDAWQITSASRPVLSARYNILTKTEDFSDAVWVKTLCTASAMNVADPIGGNTAATITSFFSNAFFFYTTGNNPLVTSVNSVWIRRRTGTGQIRFRTNAAGTDTDFTSSITSSWSLFTWNCAPSNAGTNHFVINIATSGDAIDIWHPDMRVSNDGVGLPAYQRVNTSTDYDTSGFPRYLRFDGTDDSLATSSIDFSGTDNMTVWAGVRKLSDAARGTVVELTASAASNNGAFHLTAPNAASATYAFESKGTSLTDAVASTGVAAPITNVLCGYSDISADQNILRVNGSQADSDTGDQGTGSFSNAALHVGSRGGSSLRLNARLYSLIVRGASSTAGQISDTESWVNSRTRAY